MGVSGCGKSEIGRQLAARLGLSHIEGDAYHSPASIAKMSAGIPLDDSDRADWLKTLQAQIGAARERGDGLVLSCSALKRHYRNLLRAGDPGLVFIHLDGDRELIAPRMKARTSHYMPLSLLDSQFQALERLQADEYGLRLDIVKQPEQLIEEILQQFGHARP
jgi:carbohydrate kinase (thermoresistant glucokinase family)